MLGKIAANVAEQLLDPCRAHHAWRDAVDAHLRGAVLGAEAGLTPEQTTLVESVSKLAEREFGARAFQQRRAIAAAAFLLGGLGLLKLRRCTA